MVQSHQSEEDSDSDLELGAPAGEAYHSHGAGVLDLLEGMKEKADAELADARKSEMKAQFEFNKLKKGLEDELAADTVDLKNAKTTKAEAEETKATASGDLAETEEELKNLNKMYE